jgi:hypothetical protein
MKPPREYLWYNHRFDICCVQIIMDNCYMAFQFGHHDAYDLFVNYKIQEPMEELQWIAIGEITDG